MRVLLAKSLCGHDKEHVYLILKEEGEFAYLVNGETKKLQNPKKKNHKHYQIIKKLPAELVKLFDEEQELSDALVKKSLLIYHSIQNEKHKAELGRICRKDTESADNQKQEE